jgi:methenyltetrahydromethanopterin cyclohydrolase
MRKVLARYITTYKKVRGAIRDDGVLFIQYQMPDYKEGMLYWTKWIEKAQLADLKNPPKTFDDAGIHMLKLTTDQFPVDKLPNKSGWAINVLKKI